MENFSFLPLKEKFLSEHISVPEVALYIHIPFCTSKCAYCDFYSVQKTFYESYLQRENQTKKNSRFVRKLLNDIVDLKELFQVQSFSSIYIGGGTPSLLSGEDILFLGSALSVYTKPDAECTIEVNPESLNARFIKTAISAGINRFSLGVQTFSDHILKNQARHSTRNDIERAIALLRTAENKYGIKFSCDLILGFAEQTEAQVLSDLERLLAAQLKHISLYTLCTDDYRADMQNDTAHELFAFAEKTLCANGFYRYEVSNFAKAPEYESRHNKAYWHLDNYFGVGPSAVGTLIMPAQAQGTAAFAIRTTAFPNVQAWYDARFPYMLEKLSYTDCLKDFLLMGLRLSEGINKEKFFTRFYRSFDSTLPRTILKYQDFIAVNTQKYFSLNERGLNFLSEFLVDAFLEVEQTIEKI